MVFHTVTRKICQTVFFSEGSNTLFYTLPVAGQVLIKHGHQFTGGFVDRAELHAVIADNVNRVLPHLVKDSGALPGTDHQQPVIFA